MDRQQAKKLLPIIQAYTEGKVIQTINASGEWVNNREPLFNCDYNMYRIKPEPKFRPFKDAEECWCEMLKHEPFGWTCDTFNIRDCIVRVTNSGIVYEKKLICFEDVFNKCSFVDGTPFGVKVEE